MKRLLTINPKKLARAEIGWWRAHHDKNKAMLVSNLVKQHMLLYSLTRKEAHNVLMPLFEAIKSHDKRDWNSEVKFATQYYRSIKNKTHMNFNPKEVGELEIKWWKIHDELEYNLDKTKLVIAFSKLYAEIFAIKPKKLEIASRFKAQATYQHDLAENPQTPSFLIEKHWKKAEKLLINFYSELKQVLN